MTDFATDLFWEDEKQPALPVRPHDRQPDKDKRPSAPVVPVESQSERMQRIAGNAALAREAEEAEATRKKLADAASPEKAPAKARAAETSHPQKADDADVAKPPVEAKASPAGRREAEEKQLVKAAVTAEAERLPEATKAAAARATALAQVLESFEKNAGNADLLGLARLVEAAPPGIGEEVARTIALAVMRADPKHRSAIAARIEAEFGHRRDLRLARLLADRLAWLVVVTAAPAPPPPPPPPPAPP